MPTVPFTSTPRQSLNPLPGVRLSPNAPSAAFGGGPIAPDLSGAIQGVAAIGREQDRIAFEEKAKADQIATTHSYGALVTGVNDLLHGKDGVLNRQGRDAFEIDQEAYDRFGKLEAEIREALGNDDQRAIFDKQVLNEWSRVDSQVQPHIARERQRYDAQGVDALVKGKYDEAITSYQNADVVDQNIAIAQAASVDHLKRQGAPDEVIRQKSAEIASTFRFAVLQSYLNNEQDLAATQYYEKYKGQFTGKDAQQAAKLTEAGSIRGASQKHADAILTTHGGSLIDALGQAARIDEPRVRDETEQRIRRHFADLAADQRQQRELSFNALSSKLEQNGGNIDRLKTSAAWLDLTPQDHTALERRANIIRHPDEGPGDDEQFMELQNEAYFNPEAFAERNILGERGLNAKQKQRLLTLQRTVGGQVQRKDEAAIVAGMKATEKAGIPASDRNAAALTSDPSLDRALGIGPVVPASRDAPATPTTPATPDARSASNPVGLAPVAATGFTPAMLQDVVRKGPKYAEYLAHMGVAVPANIDALVAAEKAKAEPTSPAKKPAAKKKP